MLQIGGYNHLPHATWRRGEVGEGGAPIPHSTAQLSSSSTKKIQIFTPFYDDLIKERLSQP